MKPIIRNMIKSDLENFNHEGKSVRGLVVELDGKVIGYAGVLHTVPFQAFSNMTKELRQYPKVIVKMMRRFRQVVDKYSLPVYAIASKGEGNSGKVLERTGFKYSHEHEFGSIYVWVTQ